MSGSPAPARSRSPAIRASMSSVICSRPRIPISLTATACATARSFRPLSTSTSRVERSSSPTLVLIAATSSCSRAAAASSEMIDCRLPSVLHRWPIWSERRSMRSKRCVSSSALPTWVASTTSSAAFDSTPSDSSTSGRLTPVKRFMAASISLKRNSESQLALTVSAAMSANASSNLPAMLRYQGRRAVAAVGSLVVVISRARVAATMRRLAEGEHERRHVVRWRPAGLEVADPADQGGQQVRIAWIGLRHVAGNPLVAEQLAGGVGRLRETVGQDQNRVAGAEGRVGGLIDGILAEAKRRPAVLAQPFQAAVPAPQIGRHMAGTDIAQTPGGEIESAEQEGDEHAGIVAARELVVEQRQRFLLLAV